MFGGLGTAVLTPIISVALAFVALRHPQRIAHLSNLFAIYFLHCCGGVLAVWILMEPGHTSDWMFLLGFIWPIWLLCWIAGAFGAGSAKTLFFPVTFLWFCLPYEPYLYDVLDSPLQEWTTDVAVRLLDWLGHRVQYWNAHTFYTDEFYIIVDETCSGMNMLVTLTMYALIFGWITRHRLSNRLLMVLCVLPLSLLSNGVRVAAIYLLGLKGGESLATGFWHDASGVIAFMPTLIGIYLVGEVLRRFERRRANSSKHNKTAAFTPE